MNAVQFNVKGKIEKLKHCFQKKDFESLEPNKQLKTPVIDVHALREKQWWFGNE
jgi:hypothetical protein